MDVVEGDMQVACNEAGSMGGWRLHSTQRVRGHVPQGLT